MPRIGQARTPEVPPELPLQDVSNPNALPSDRTRPRAAPYAVQACLVACSGV